MARPLQFWSGVPSVLLALLSALIFAACAGPGAELEPAPGANRVGADIAVDEVAGVYVETEVNAWPGADGPTDRFTAIRVRLRNRSDREVQVQYPAFGIFGPRGHRYEARAPRNLAPPEPERPRSALFPEFEASEGEAYYEDLDPQLETNRTRRLLWSIDPYETFERVWTSGLPIERMEALRLREGPLGPGQEREGLLYFERVPPGGGELELRFDLAERGTGEHLGAAVIPLQRRG